MGNPLTICVCVRNGQLFIDNCLSSLLRETQAFQTPRVVVNHLSTDQTLSILEKWAEFSAGRIKVFTCLEPGLAAARNFAWRKADSEWVGFVDVDCEVQADWGTGVYATLKAFTEDARCAAFGGNNQVPRAAGALYEAYALFLNTYLGGHNSSLNRKIHAQHRVNHLPTLNIVYRYSALMAVKGFDASYTRVGEDIDLSYRLRRLDYDLWIIPSIKVVHKLRAQVAAWARNMFLYGRGRIFFIKRNPPSFHPKFAVPLLLVVLYLALIACAAVGVVSVSAFLALASLHLFGVLAVIGWASVQSGSGFKAFLMAVGMVILTHLSYGLGSLKELFGSRGHFK
jgi:glycosyltransferase involved in cell wall biosynthesis